MVLALQVSEKDVYIGQELIRLICDIEERKRSDVTFVISGTRGTNKQALETAAKLAGEKFFDVRIIFGKRFGKGWPNGCNDLWAETMMRVEMLKQERKVSSKWVLTFEPDCIMLQRKWIDILMSEADRADRAGMLAIGHQHNEPKTHLNGNAIFKIGILRQMPFLDGSDAMTGWDVFHRNKILPVSLDSPEIHQIYRIRHIKPQRVAEITKNGKRPALFHGIKGMLGIEAVRWMMQNGQLT